MWSTLGSFRERVRENAIAVRENAKAAAVVAQGVLQAAAFEDEDTIPTNPTSNLLNESAVDQPQPYNESNPSQPQSESVSSSDQFASHSIPPPPPDASPHMPPPPPSQEIDAQTHSFHNRRTRASRYVPGGPPPSTKVHAPLVPVPSIFASAPPQDVQEDVTQHQASSQAADWPDNADADWGFDEGKNARSEQHRTGHASVPDVNDLQPPPPPPPPQTDAQPEQFTGWNEAPEQDWNLESNLEHTSLRNSSQVQSVSSVVEPTLPVQEQHLDWQETPEDDWNLASNETSAAQQKDTIIEDAPPSVQPPSSSPQEQFVDWQEDPEVDWAAAPTNEAETEQEDSKAHGVTSTVHPPPPQQFVDWKEADWNSGSKDEVAFVEKDSKAESVPVASEPPAPTEQFTDWQEAPEEDWNLASNDDSENGGKEAKEEGVSSHAEQLHPSEQFAGWQETSNVPESDWNFGSISETVPVEQDSKAEGQPVVNESLAPSGQFSDWQEAPEDSEAGWNLGFSETATTQKDTKSEDTLADTKVLSEDPQKAPEADWNYSNRDDTTNKLDDAQSTSDKNNETTATTFPTPIGSSEAEDQTGSGESGERIEIVYEVSEEQTQPELYAPHSESVNDGNNGWFADEQVGNGEGDANASDFFSGGHSVAHDGEDRDDPSRPKEEPFSSETWGPIPPAADANSVPPIPEDIPLESQGFDAAIGFGEHTAQANDNLVVQSGHVWPSENSLYVQNDEKAVVESVQENRKSEPELPNTVVEETGQRNFEVPSLSEAQKDEFEKARKQVEELSQKLQVLSLERDSAVSDKEASDRANEDLKISMLQLRDDLSIRAEDLESLRYQINELCQERDALVEEKLLVEKERDAAVERGGNGIREARNIIEVMRNGQDVAGRREAVISEQLGVLRNDLERIAEERNSFIAEADDLKEQLRDSEAQAKLRDDALHHQIRVLENEVEVAKLEREQALTTSQIHIEEHRELLESEQSKSSSLSAYQDQIRELQSVVEATHRERDEESHRIEALSNLMEEMKERTQSVLMERNDLYDQKLILQKELEEVSSREDMVKRQLLDAQRELASVSGERDEAKQRNASLRDQFKDLSNRFEAISMERDRLVHERTTNASGSNAASEKEKALVAECQQKTAAVAGLQRKLTSAVAKIEKLTTQRGTFQRQRDEAGARLRAAGAEFASLNGKLVAATEARDSVQVELVQVRNERDAAISKVEELSEITAQKKIVEESAEAAAVQLAESQAELQEIRGELSEMSANKSDLQKKHATLQSEAKVAQNKYDIAIRERELLQGQYDVVLAEKESQQAEIAEQLELVSEANKKCKALQVELSTEREKAVLEIGIVKSELAAEQNARSQLSQSSVTQQSELRSYKDAIVHIHSSAATSISASKKALSQATNSSLAGISWPSVPEVGDGDNDVISDETVSFFSEICSLIARISTVAAQASRDVERTHTKHMDLQKRIDEMETEKHASDEKDQQLQNMRTALESSTKKLQSLMEENEVTASRLEDVQNDMDNANIRNSELEQDLERVTNELSVAREVDARRVSEESARYLQEIEKLSTNLKSIWSMLRNCLANQQVEEFSEAIDDDDEMRSVENIAVQSLRSVASVVAEMERNRQHTSELERNLEMAEADVARLVDRAEMAEQERDAVRGSNERLERKANSARAEGVEEAKVHFEEIIAQIESDLNDTRQELRRTTDKAMRSEKEAGELRALCSKIQSQLNGRTNELDDAEEKVVYLQDQVTTLEEDLQEAHRSLKQREAESAEARRSDVDRLTKELEDAMKQLESVEKECARLREACDNAESNAKEAEFLADTHRVAEENLQIAIEQLEAAQDSAVLQRTIELQRKLEKAEAECEAAKKREESLSISENKLQLRDDEIKELRGALGRLADERVELKLELEKSLSRLNHPDAGGQLVDRRVVRQLLVSYFRVGSMRRRDVLELMSRMLAFSDADNVAVGLKRRAFMDRIGSLVQAPEMDSATLPPIGTVSDKWIEFLMKETEEGEEEGKGW